MSEPADSDDVGDGPAEVHYIVLTSYPKLLEFSQLRTEETVHREKATLVVRDEYTEFIQHALAFSLFDAFVPPVPILVTALLSRAFDVSSTRGVAGRLVEGLMDAPQLPAVLGSGGGPRPSSSSATPTSSPPKRPHNSASPVPPAAAAKLPRRGRDGRDDRHPARPAADLPRRHSQQGLWHHARHHCQTAAWGGHRSGGPQRCSLLRRRQHRPPCPRPPANALETRRGEVLRRGGSLDGRRAYQDTNVSDRRLHL
ncbi:hypothetical protein B0H17DRAFT_1111116 [Mycena rosella]|uniref:Uncharacterized protein n=1 Tax=Mycena rosella TaxID=1033263 RepID=A0AAD7BM63_MYCRO|nr:hypothetical protein B0H17DRAFT_1111116 [Mycena rosella]